MLSSPVPEPHWRGRNQPVINLVNFLAQALRKPVIDRTGLDGGYDFDVSWNREPPDDPGNKLYGPRFIAALRKQLELKLEAEKTDAGFLVIGRIERPSEN